MWRTGNDAVVMVLAPMRRLYLYTGVSDPTMGTTCGTSLAIHEKHDMNSFSCRW